MTKKLLYFGILTLMVIGLGIFLSGCSVQPNNPVQVNVTGSTVQGIENVVDANNQFAFDLYHELKANQGNIFYSPYSISSALAITYEGAEGETAEEMKSVFYFTNKSALRPNFAAIYEELNKNDKEYELKTGNALWAQYDYSFLDGYFKTIENYYGGKIENLDFKTKTEDSRKTINSYIETQTNNKIKDLIPAGTLNPLTKLVLTNAIYFKGTWEWEFDKSDTRDRDFKITPTDVVQVPMMQMDPEKARFNYADLDKLQIIELPYKGEEVSMIILLPKQGERYDFETQELIKYNYTLNDIELSAEKLNDYKSQMSESSLDKIMVPKFEFDEKYSMKNTLNSLGLTTAFTENADFSGMTGKKDLYISEVIHQAYIKVDEKGTEAAAATAVVMKATSAGPSPSRRFIADHPFIFLIQQKETGNILFMGRVTDPTQ